MSYDRGTEALKILCVHDRYKSNFLIETGREHFVMTEPLLGSPSSRAALPGRPKQIRVLQWRKLKHMEMRKIIVLPVVAV